MMVPNVTYEIGILLSKCTIGYNVINPTNMQLPTFPFNNGEYQYDVLIPSATFTERVIKRREIFNNNGFIFFEFALKNLNMGSLHFILLSMYLNIVCSACQSGLFFQQSSKFKSYVLTLRIQPVEIAKITAQISALLP